MTSGNFQIMPASHASCTEMT